MITEIAFAIIIIIVVGGLVYIIQILAELIRHQVTQNNSLKFGSTSISSPKVSQEPKFKNPIHPNCWNQQGKSINETQLDGSLEDLPTNENCQEPKCLSSPSIVSESHGLQNEAIESKKKALEEVSRSKLLCIFRKGLNTIRKKTFDSKDNDPLLLEMKLRKKLKKHSELQESVGKLEIYKLNLRQVSIDESSKLKKFEFGKSNIGISAKNEKVILLVGATGSGKTTLINSMINYVFGVQYEDGFRFKLVTEDSAEYQNQAHSQTSWTTAYTIHHQKGFKVNYTLTIIDTPGFGDTRGIQRDAEITKQIKTFFTAKGNLGIDHINAVGLVAQSSLPRLTFTQKYIFDQILLLFGKNIGENIYLMLTFADGKVPQVLNGIKEANLPYQDYFKFNNSVIFDENSSEDQFTTMFWKMGMGSFQNFFSNFAKISPKSLTQTKLVLEERERIETQIEGLQFEVKLGLSKLEQLKNEVDIVLQHETDIARNKDFTYIIEGDAIVKHDLKPNSYVTNCLTCNFTCHLPCSYANDDDKHKCSAMNGGGKDNAHCTVCNNRCHWSQHKNMGYYFSTERKSVTKTSDDLKQRYQDANGRVKSSQQIVKEMVEEFEAHQIKIVGITDVLGKSINKLNKIALKPHSLSTSQYISILIESEKSSAEPGWLDRVQQLTHVKEKVDNLNEIAQEGFDPFEPYKRKIQEERKTKQGAWCAVDDYLQKIKYWVV